VENQRAVVVTFVAGGALMGVFVHHLVDAALRAAAMEVPAVLSALTAPVLAGLVAGVLTFFILLRHERARAFVDSVVTELYSVTWPSREETTSNTGIVVGATVVFAALLAVYDLAWGKVAEFFLYG
jgi:preprotein translocase SecE subunit